MSSRSPGTPGPGSKEPRAVGRLWDRTARCWSGSPFWRSERESCSRGWPAGLVGPEAGLTATLELIAVATVVAGAAGYWLVGR